MIEHVKKLAVSLSAFNIQLEVTGVRVFKVACVIEHFFLKVDCSADSQRGEPGKSESELCEDGNFQTSQVITQDLSSQVSNECDCFGQ